MTSEQQKMIILFYTIGAFEDTYLPFFQLRLTSYSNHDFCITYRVFRIAINNPKLIVIGNISK